jgi:hypothetical protein
MFSAKSKAKGTRSKALRTAYAASTDEQPETRVVEVILCVHIFYEQLINLHQERSRSGEVESHTLVVTVAQANNVGPSAKTRSETKQRGGPSPSPASTALNVFKYSLETLEGASDCVPVAGIKGSISRLLSAVIKCEVGGINVHDSKS